MPGKQSKLGYQMMLAEVSEKAHEAFRSGVYTNPYPYDDKRHARFERKLNAIKAADWLLEG
jgi:sugar (pentulose or hexulose) kinase